MDRLMKGYWIALYKRIDSQVKFKKLWGISLLE
jgi:hypothetical protein